VSAPSPATVIVFAATLVLGWLIPLGLSYAIRPLADFTRGARPPGEQPERAYLLVKYGVFAGAMIAYAVVVWFLTQLPGVLAWPSWGAFAYSALGALSAISDADRQAWSDTRRRARRVMRRARRQSRQTP
jgi:Zn-dependent protease with chaperone function